MSTAAVERTLLTNIKANLNDTTNHPEAYALFKNGGVKALPVLLPLASPAPYCVIVPGSSVGDSSAMVEHVVLQVTVWVVVSILNDPYNEATVLGGASLDDGATLCRVVRTALVRNTPYTGTPYNASPYTEQPGVISVTHVGTSGFQTVIDDSRGDEDGPDLYLARGVTLEYEFWEA